MLHQPSAGLHQSVLRKLVSDQLLIRRGIVEILVACEAAVDRLSHQIAQRELLVGTLPRIRQMLVDQPALSESFSSSRIRINPPSEVTLDPWKSTLRNPLKVN